MYRVVNVDYEGVRFRSFIIKSSWMSEILLMIEEGVTIINEEKSPKVRLLVTTKRSNVSFVLKVNI